MMYGVAKPHLFFRGHEWFARRRGIGCVTSKTPFDAYWKLGGLAVAQYEQARRSTPAFKHVK